MVIKRQYRKSCDDGVVKNLKDLHVDFFAISCEFYNFFKVKICNRNSNYKIVKFKIVTVGSNRPSLNFPLTDLLRLVSLHIKSWVLFGDNCCFSAYSEC